MALCCVLGCLLAVEAIPLHFTFFSKLWMEVYQKAGDVRKRLLFSTEYSVGVADTVLIPINHLYWPTN